MRFLLMAFTHASRAEGVVVSGFECYGFWRHRHRFLILDVNNHLLGPAVPDLLSRKERFPTTFKYLLGNFRPFFGPWNNDDEEYDFLFLIKVVLSDCKSNHKRQLVPKSTLPKTRSTSRLGMMWCELILG